MFAYLKPAQMPVVFLQSAPVVLLDRLKPKTEEYLRIAMIRESLLIQKRTFRDWIMLYRNCPFRATLPTSLDWACAEQLELSSIACRLMLVTFIFSYKNLVLHFSPNCKCSETEQTADHVMLAFSIQHYNRHQIKHEV